MSFIVAHVGSRDCSLLPGALYCVAVNYNKESEDYHNSMNSQVYLHWLRETMFPGIRHPYPAPSRVALVLDHATYHRTLTEDTSRSWKKLRKADLIAFLLDRGVPAEELPPNVTQTIPELHELAELVVGPPIYEV